MFETILLRMASILIICVGIYVFARPIVVSEKIKSFYSNYPIIRYAGEKQQTSRLGFVRFIGATFIIVGFICLFSIH
jgi:uncharacterized membrane protein HdeD (DUF308 family)